MKVSTLVLKQFRNLAPVTIFPHPNVNLIVGLNASGKTNLCEALYYASRGQLLKGERQREVINWDATWSTIKLDVEDEDIRIHLNEESNGKLVELSGESVQQRAVFEVFKVLIFTPDNLQIVKGSPSKRRQLLDRSIADIDIGYRRESANYEQVLRRKNALLKQDRGDTEVMSVYNQKLVEHGTVIIQKRLEYLDAIRPHLEKYHSELNQAHKPLILRYDSEVSYSSDIQPQLEDALKLSLTNEIQRRQSLVGPHRDDLGFEVDGVDLRRYGSQGQQKTALIALKLSQLQLFKERLGEYPVLILDDVLSELDPQRTQLLLDHLPENIQLFLTETDLSEPLRQRAGKVFRVHQGEVIELTEEEICSSTS
jgi:DNA replication and repair protein RecF